MSIRSANAIALLALFVALGGVSWAAITLPRNSVGSKQLKRNAVTSKKVKNRSLLAADFKRGQLPAGPRGQAGPKGDPGPAGANGVDGRDFAYARTRVVSPADDPVASGNRLRDAVASITDAGPARPYLIVLEPGAYQLDAALALPEHVDLRGAGAERSVIRADHGESAAITAGNTHLSDLSVTRVVPAVSAPYVGIGAVKPLVLDDVSVSLEGPGAAQTRAVVIQDGRITDSALRAQSAGATATALDVHTGRVTVSGGRLTAEGTFAGGVVAGARISDDADVDLRGLDEIGAFTNQGTALAITTQGTNTVVHVDASTVTGSGGTNPRFVNQGGFSRVYIGASSLTGSAGGDTTPVCAASYKRSGVPVGPSCS